MWGGWGKEDLPIPIAHSICLLFVPNEPFPAMERYSRFQLHIFVSGYYCQSMAEYVFIVPFSAELCYVGSIQWRREEGFSRNSRIARRKSKQAENYVSIECGGRRWSRFSLVSILYGVLQLISHNICIYIYGQCGMEDGGINGFWLRADGRTLKSFYCGLWKLPLQLSVN